MSCSAPQKQMATKAARKSCPEQDQEIKPPASFDHLIALAKQKLEGGDDLEFKCASCENDIEKSQIVGVDLEQIREIDDEAENEDAEVGNIWFCNDCFEEYTSGITAPFEDFSSNEWTSKGQLEDGTEIGCVFETVTMIKVRRVNELKITHDEVDYLLLDCGDPLEDEEAEMEE
ncbi:hypothetical protein M3Y97_01006800 [Aphelenchoides bicaudatus]|nr:hypothetical protein M3Y97_01006800 [Aphelenchoides bicaudatus]